MPLHKSSRAPRLDPTMISAPLGDFRHTMHIGRGGDAFGDTSFLSTIGPSSSQPDPESSGTGPDADLQPPVDPGDLHTDGSVRLQDDGLQHSGSVSSFTLDLDLDLGPSMLGDVLGVMDTLGLDEEEDVFAPKSGAPPVSMKQGKAAPSPSMSVSMHNELNEKSVGWDENPVGDDTITDGGGVKSKGLRPKVRFSDKREEIIRQASEEEEGRELEFQEEDQRASSDPVKGESESGEGVVVGNKSEFTNHKLELPPSPPSSHSSEYDGVVSLDRRRVDSCQSETDSEEEEEMGRGYTFEDEFDDEIGL
ncbi:cdc42 effector protein 5 [Brachionichthys hirsutus]|uniref:cdc42 effector protein 5 n=1 Tax=Brachionichthys hirsutus TaxID=412623 RepID=UPI0036044BD5